MIYIVDFGSQTAHLISRRVRELGSECKIVQPEEILFSAQNDKETKGIILSGGPSSVYVKNAPTIDPKVFELGVPILGICYGLQIMAKMLGGKVVSGRKEYGPAELRIKNLELRIKNGLPKDFTVWMSHGDEVVSLSEGFDVLGSTDHVRYAFVVNEEKKLYGVQFHPEVEHTEYGLQILRNFVSVCHPELVLGSKSLKNGMLKQVQHDIDIDKMKEKIKKTVGDAYVIGAVSGGVDSTVAAALTARAIGQRFVPIYVENGLMREGTEEYVKKIFRNIGIKPIVVNRIGEMLFLLKKIEDSEKKRKIIGNFYIKVFEEEMKKLIKSGKKVNFLLQGTIYSDVIESKGTKHASKIKSHHNVGGLPKNMKLQLLEPLREFYKDEVRKIGKLLGLPDEFVWKQPFPGPGYAVRIRGEVTKERLDKEKQADKIVMEELGKAGMMQEVFLSFPVMTGAYSTAVKGDGRQFGEVIALRIIESKDIMTTTWSRLPYDLLQKISSRIVNEVPQISRVVYDITTKPPATMEWE